MRAHGYHALSARIALPFVLPAVDFRAENVCLRHMFARTPLDALHRAQPESEKY
jgi:hypothetical protein